MTPPKAPRTSTRTTAAETPAGGLAGWKLRAGPHTATLGSGQQIEFRLLGIGELALRGAIPTHLRELVALHILNEHKGGVDAVLADDFVRSSDGPDAEARLEQHLTEAFELNKLLVCEALVSVAGEPVTLTPADIDELPFEDIEELVQLVTGQKAFDSRGVRIGVEPVDALARFHDLHRIEGRPADCPACAEYRRELSSLHGGQL